ncbi:MAG: zinc ABC transporter substrate-binding protein, partial [Muribaculaceae bacterium]|nr:zinc ABC transporter substrate-binding protein [Muribaculaceae bacterium]
SNPIHQSHSSDRSDPSDPSDLSSISPTLPTHSHHENPGMDPHTWTSIKNLKVMATNMLEAVNDIDPANKPLYTANYQQLIHRLDSIDASISSRLAQSSTRAFLIWHPSLSYFSRDYSLEQIPLGQDNKEMTPGQLRDIHQRAAKEGVKVMFIQQNFDASQAKTIADELGVTVVQINPLDDDYLRQFNILTDALAQ